MLKLRRCSGKYVTQIISLKPRESRLASKIEKTLHIRVSSQIIPRSDGHPKGTKFRIKKETENKALSECPINTTLILQSNAVLVSTEAEVTQIKKGNEYGIYLSYPILERNPRCQEGALPVFMVN